MPATARQEKAVKTVRDRVWSFYRALKLGSVHGGGVILDWAAGREIGVPDGGAGVATAAGGLGGSCRTSLRPETPSSDLIRG
jgi:hypothetical protein